MQHGFTADVSVKLDVVLHHDFNKKEPADIRQPVGMPVREQARPAISPMLKTVVVGGIIVVGVVIVPLIAAAALTAAASSRMLGPRTAGPGTEAGDARCSAPAHHRSQ
jgi:hypothetical protein